MFVHEIKYLCKYQYLPCLVISYSIGDVDFFKIHLGNIFFQKDHVMGATCQDSLLHTAFKVPSIV